MRIIHVINSLGNGGAEVLLSNTIKLLPEYEHLLITLSGPHDQLDKLTPLIKSHYCLNVTSPKQWLKGIWMLRRIINKYDPMLMHAHLQVSGLIGKLACPRRIPFFYTLHSAYSIDSFAVNRFALFTERITARKYHHLIGVSSVALKDYQVHVSNSGSGDVVYNMVGDEYFLETDFKPYVIGETLKLVSVGNLKRAKNYLYTLQAFKELKDLPIHLDIYGEGPDRKNLQVYIDKTGLSNVRLMGQSSEIASLLKDYNGYVISSIHEGFGIAPLEAMASGLPTFASNIAIFKEVLGNAVQYFDLEDPTSLAKILRHIWEGKINLLLLSKLARSRSEAIARSGAYKEHLLEVYKKYTPS